MPVSPRLAPRGAVLQRHQVFGPIPGTAGRQEQCLLCGHRIRVARTGGNAFAQSAHLRTHAADVVPHLPGEYRACHDLVRFDHRDTPAGPLDDLAAQAAQGMLPRAELEALPWSQAKDYVRWLGHDPATFFDPST